MKIFEIQDTDYDEKRWVAAETNIQALKTYCSITSTDIDEFDDEDTIREVPDSELDELKMLNTDFDESEPEDDSNFRDMTFRRWLELNKQPDMFAFSICISDINYIIQYPKAWKPTAITS